MKAMETINDLIEEAKLRTVWWALCIFVVSYFLTNTSKSMWMNVPVSILLVCGLRILLNEVEFRWKTRISRPQTYLSHLEKKQLSVNDSRLSTVPPPAKWKRKIDSPVVEAAMEDFIKKVLQDFVVDLWYSDITPDKEAPELIRAVIMDALGEISARVKEINLIDLLTRDVVDLIGNHLELFRKNHIAIGRDVMGTLSSEERDERLKNHLLASKDLHPALISPECEYKVLKQLIGGVLAIVLRPREAQCPLVRCIAREIVTCLVVQPVMNLICPGYVNELVEYILLMVMDEGFFDGVDVQSPSVKGHDHVATADTVPINSDTRKSGSSHTVKGEMTSSVVDIHKESSLNTINDPVHDGSVNQRPADWARILEATTQRRTEVLMPENLENMWTKGRNYKKKGQISASTSKGTGTNTTVGRKDTEKEIPGLRSENSIGLEDEQIARLLTDAPGDPKVIAAYVPKLKREASSEGTSASIGVVNTYSFANESKGRLKRSNSTSDLKVGNKMDTEFQRDVAGPIISEFYSADVGRQNEVHVVNNLSDSYLRIQGQQVPKLKCRVIGAYFEKLGSKSFAVYSIAVTDVEKKTWFVKRRYSNFERLHRHLKDIPNYTLHLPPKRIFSSSTEDAFVHQRCIQLDKYLQDLLSIANVAEQHEVWDFLSASSKNYSSGRSSSVMKTLAVNVDEAVDDIVRQFKGVSDGLMRKVSGPSYEPSSLVSGRSISGSADEINSLILRHSTAESANSLSDTEEAEKDGSHGHEEAGSSAEASGWHSDNELNSKEFPPRVVKRDELHRSFDSDQKHDSVLRSELLNLAANFPSTSDYAEDPLGVPPEWTPPNLTVPILNLVDNVFQLKRRGWLRRQVFWMSKQILQLMMEDAIDDWLLRQIHWLRREDTVARGIRWIQDILWPQGTFFISLSTRSRMSNFQPDPRSSHTIGHLAGSRVLKPGSFEQQLEAARVASNVKKMIFNGAPTALVSLIGSKQYNRSAKDIYYFLQSTICLKQLGYGILELVLVTVFPELHDVILDVHGNVQS